MHTHTVGRAREDFKSIHFPNVLVVLHYSVYLLRRNIYSPPSLISSLSCGPARNERWRQKGKNWGRPGTEREKRQPQISATRCYIEFSLSFSVCDDVCRPNLSVTNAQGRGCCVAKGNRAKWDFFSSLLLDTICLRYIFFFCWTFYMYDKLWRLRCSHIPWKCIVWNASQKRKPASQIRPREIWKCDLVVRSPSSSFYKNRKSFIDRTIHSFFLPLLQSSRSILAVKNKSTFQPCFTLYTFPSFFSKGFFFSFFSFFFYWLCNVYPWTDKQKKKTVPGASSSPASSSKCWRLCRVWAVVHFLTEFLRSVLFSQCWASTARFGCCFSSLVGSSWLALAPPPPPDSSSSHTSSSSLVSWATAVHAPLSSSIFRRRRRRRQRPIIS